jgi:DNA-binding NtrC family response regulator
VRGGERVAELHAEAGGAEGVEGPLGAHDLLAACFIDRPLRAETVRALEAHDWPGNVRELRNVLERANALAGPDGPAWDDVLGFARPGRPRAAGAAIPVDPTVPFREAKERLVDAWEREYLAALLAACGGNVSAAARRGGMDRAYLHKLLEKHDLRRR